LRRRYASPARKIQAELIGGDACRAFGTTVRGPAPLLKLCRRLVETGHDPATPLRVFRGEVLCLKVRSIGEAAGLTVDESRTAFARWKPFPHAAVSPRIAPSEAAGLTDPDRDEAYRAPVRRELGARSVPGGGGR
jgi:hypothetical protein